MPPPFSNPAELHILGEIMHGAKRCYEAADSAGSPTNGPGTWP